MDHSQSATTVWITYLHPGADQGWPPKLWIANKDGVVHDGGLYPDDHPLLVDEPLDQLDEGRDDGSIPHLLDHQHCQWRLVPGQSLGGWVLDGPEN